MKVFVSYSRADLDTAEAIALSIRGSGNSVFFDRDSLPKGDEFDNRIRGEICECDLFVFLISPSSICKGSYARTELKFAREQWPHPSGHVLPVLIATTPIDEVPTYLRCINILEPEGNVVAEVTSEIQRLSISRARLPRLSAFILSAMGITVVALLSTSAFLDRPFPLRSALTRPEQEDFEAKIITPAVPAAEINSSKGSEQFTLVSDFSARLQSIMTTLNRIRHGTPAPNGFYVGNDLVPLTAVFEGLVAYRLQLGDTYYQLLLTKAQLALQLANAGTDEDAQRISREWTQIADKIAEAAALQKKPE